jgi:glyoxylase-like metal-dependent hydrolase (beta-lactamase superfamily II)
VPTFDRARYVFSPAEWQFWKDDPDAQPQFGSAAVLQDSVWPLARAGRVDLREPGFVLAPGVSLGAGHGHTPGHLIVLIESDGQRAVITGDSIHSPVQLVDPGWHGRADLDLPASIEFRRALLAEAAANDRVVFGTHFPDPCAGAVVATRRGYRFEPVPAR